MQFPNSKGRSAVIVGVGIIAAVFIFAGIAKKSSNSIPLEDTYKNIVGKKELLSQMRIHLHKSVEMEKSAVMAITDEESQEFADQSVVASAAVEHNLKLLRALMDTVPLQDEKKLAGEFTNCWTELSKLDQTILELAVQNTNLKAASLSQKKGGAAIQRFEQALEGIRASAAGSPDEGRVTGLIYQAMTAGLKLYNLHSPHIAEANDENMDHIEAKMKGEETEVAKSLDALAGIVGEEHRDALSQAKTAFSEFLDVTAKVIKLSRQNSNIKSLELSLGRKRKVATQCDEILAAFQEAVQSRTFKATR